MSRTSPGVWPHLSSLMTVISLKHAIGHAKRAGLVAAANAYMGRLVVVVDDDIDPSSLEDVMWAVATRCEASEGIDIVRNAWSSHLDPRIPPQDKERGATAHSKLIIEACRPFAWQDRFPVSRRCRQTPAGSRRNGTGCWMAAANTPDVGAV